jgi:hypothetical protein
MATRTLAWNRHAVVVKRAEKSNCIGMADIAWLCCRNVDGRHVNCDNTLPFGMTAIAITGGSFEYSPDMATTAFCNSMRAGQGKTCSHVVKALRLSFVAGIGRVRLSRYRK